jgi:glucosamine kinase
VSEHLYLGIDAGGTKTVALLGDAHRRLGRGVAGPANPSLVGVDGTVAAVREAVSSAFADAAIERVAVVVAWIGGAGSVAWRRALLAQAAALGADHVELSHDGRLLLAVAKLDEGIGLVAGTGSSAYARDHRGSEATSGGWGHLLGDEGGGYDIARAGMRAASQAIDGRGPGTALVPALLATLGADGASDLRARAYPAAAVEETASFAAHVLDCAADGDPVAAAIIAGAGRQLSDLCAAAAAPLDIEAPRHIVAGGGLLHAGSPLLAAVAAHLPANEEYVLREIDDEPAVGALALARQADRKDRRRHRMERPRTGTQPTITTKGGIE